MSDWIRRAKDAQAREDMSRIRLDPDGPELQVFAWFSAGSPRWHAAVGRDLRAHTFASACGKDLPPLDVIRQEDRPAGRELCRHCTRALG